MKDSRMPERERAFLFFKQCEVKVGPENDVLAEDTWPGCVFLPLLVGTGQQEGAAVVLRSSYPGTEGRGQTG